jgi:hypothetical protein
MLVQSKKRNSILGSIALLVAVPAVGLNYFTFSGLPNVAVGPFELHFPTAVAAGVTALALLSLLLASASRRTGTEVPLAALMVGVVALGIGYFRHRPAPAAPTASTAAPTPAQAPAPQTATVQKPAPKSPALPGASAVTGQIQNTANAPTEVTLRQRNLANLREAESRFDAAKASAIKSLESDPAYAAAKSDSDSTLADLKNARAEHRPGDPALVKASQSALIAHDKLQTIIDAAFAQDHAVQDAKANLASVKAAMKSSPGAKQ